MPWLPLFMSAAIYLGHWSPPSAHLMSPRPLLWETPSSSPSTPPPDVYSFAPADKVDQLTLEARRKAIESGPQAGIYALRDAEAPELWLLRAEFRLALNDEAKANADFQKFQKVKSQTIREARALETYKNFLKQGIAQERLNYFAHFFQCLEAEWRNEEALVLAAELDEKKDLPPSVTELIKNRRPVWAARAGRYEEAAAWLSPADNQDKMNELAKVELFRGRYAEAASLRLKLAEMAQDKRSENLELAAAFRILAKSGQFTKAEKLFQQHSHVLSKVSAEDPHWLLGLSALMARQYENGHGYFEKILKDNLRRKLWPAARYFLARSLEMAGRDQEAKAIFAQSAQGAGYYAILAQGRLVPGEYYLDVPMAALLNPPLGSGDNKGFGYYLWLGEKGISENQLAEIADLLTADSPILSLAAENFKTLSAELTLFNSDLETYFKNRDWAAAAVSLQKNRARLIGPSRPFKAQQAAAWPALAGTLAAKAENYELALRFFEQLPRASTGFDRSTKPLVYNREILEAHRRYGLPPQLMLALIHKESTFRSHIMSSSMGRGVMQLLPSTAEQAAARLGDRRPDWSELFQPAINIRYGSWYLAALIEGFGEIPLALAGYNGGPYNIKNLINAKTGQPLDIFIETLPFKPNVDYVKDIVELIYIYEMAYLGKANSPDFSRPVKPPSPELPDF